MSDVTLREWARTWVRAGAELEALRRRELAAVTEQQARRAALDILSFPLPLDLPPRTESGLVEQQRLFAKIRDR